MRKELTNSPAVSVLMAVFNGDTYLSEAVESILGQTFTDFEFIIIDDGSTDKTGEILRSYAKGDGCVRIFSQENKGRAESLNRGIELARAPLIARMDADDIALPDRFQRQVDFLNSHPEVGLLGGASIQIDSSGGTIRSTEPPLGDAQIREVMTRHNPMCHPTVMMRKEIALAVGGYRKLLLDTDDYDLWLRMIERTKVANLEQPILRYRIHPRQVSIQNMAHQTWCVIAARTAAACRARGEPDPLREAKEITPEFLHRLGVTPKEIQQALIGVHEYWIWAFIENDPKLAGAFASGLSRLLVPGVLPRSALANMWLWLAGIHYRQGGLTKALSYALRGLLTRPIIAGRPIKRAVMRLAHRTQL